MSKIKRGFDKDTIKDFFIHHGEKVGLGVCVVVIGVVSWLGYSKDSLKDDLDPKTLASQADTKLNAINNASWDEYRDLRTVNESPDTSDKMLDGLFLAGTLNENPLPRREPRLDPELKAPTDIQVTGQWVSVGISETEGNIANIQQRAFFAEKKRRRRSDDDDDDQRSPFGGSGGYPSGEGGGSPYSGGGNPYGGSGGEQPGAGGSGAAGDGAPGGAPGGAGPQLPANVVKIPDVMKRELPGIAGVPRFTGSSAQLRELYAMSVTAVVPYENQWLEYENKFQNAMSYDPGRDYPEYVYLDVERRVDGGEWEPYSERVKSYEGYYVIESPSVIDPLYADPTLTLPVPPLVVGDYDKLALHPKVMKLAFEEEAEEEETATADENSADNPFGGSNSAASSGEAASAGDQQRPGGGYPSGGGGYPSGDSGYPSGQGGGSPYEGGGNPYGDGGYPSGEGGGSPYEGGGSPYSGGGNPYGGGGRTGARLTGPERDDVDVKLVRFYDFNVEAGKTYEYRVRVWLADANDPEAGGNTGASGGMPGAGSGGGEQPGGAGGSGAPGGGFGGGGDARRGASTVLSNNSLDPSVRNRLKVWKESEEYLALEATDPRKHARATEWSEVTAPYRVPEHTADLFAGPVELPSPLSAEGVVFSQGEAIASIAANVWDSTLALKVPGGNASFRGELIDFSSAEPKVMNPLDLSLRIPNLSPEEAEERKKDDVAYRLQTDSFLIDIRGGEPLPTDVPSNYLENPLTAPSEVLVFDMAGNFTIRSEFDDIRGYRHSLFLEDDKVEKPKPRVEEEDNSDGYPGFGGGPSFGGGYGGDR